MDLNRGQSDYENFARFHCCVGGGCESVIFLAH